MIAGRWRLLLLLGALLGGALVRCVDLGQRELGANEIAVLAAADPHLTAPNPLPPLRSYLLPGTVARWMTHWGYGESVLRLPGALAGSLAVAFGCLLAIQGGSLAGPFAALLLALLPALVSTARVLGPQAWAVLFTSAALYWLIRAQADTRAGQGRARLSWLAAALCLLGLGCVCLAAFGVWPILFVACLWRGWREKCWDGALALSGVGVAFLGLWIWSAPRLLPQLVTPPLDARLLLTLGNSLPPATGALLMLLAGIGVWRVRDTATARLALWWYLGALLPMVLARQRGAQIEAAEIAVLLTAATVLAGHGLASVLEAMSLAAAALPRRAPLPRGAIRLVAGVVPCLIVLGTGWLGSSESQPLPWRAVAQLLRDNLAADERVVVLLERDSLAFYAPDLESRLDPVQPPGRALAYFSGRRRGWLIVPEVVRFYPAWPRVAALVEQFRAVDLSPDDRLRIYYISRDGLPATLQRVASFRLPQATLARGDLLPQLVREVRATSGVLWKVDQLALGAPLAELRNPSLLGAARLLIEQGHDDRAGSLVYRLATAVPEWPEAEALLAAFQP